MTNPSLHALHADAQNVLLSVRSEFGALDDIGLNWIPDSAKWSVAQCLDHMTVSDRLYYDALRKAILDGRAKNRLSTDPIRPGFLGKRFIRMVGPDGRTMKNPQIFSPTKSSLTRDVLNDFENHQKELMELVRRSDGLNLNRIRMYSPVSRLFRFSIGEAFMLLLAHQHRHLIQAQHLTGLPQFGCMKV